jgi:ribosomal protein L11 methyltransferase
MDARAAAEQALRGLGAGDLEIRSVNLVDDGWSTRWREHFRPVVLEKLQVITPWMIPPRPDLISIVIDPGQAFGTGGHATTRLILRLLERRAAEGALPETLLDVGTGSGILAVAAARLGARKVTAIDSDAASVEAARENAVANRVSARIDLCHGPISELRGRWPLVLANLELAIFLKHAPDIARCVADRGALLLSGLLADQAAACLALWPGFRTLDRQEEDGWAALALERNA